MMQRKNSILLAVVAALCLIFMPCAANAAQFACDGSGGMVAGSQLYDASVTGHTGACEATGITHIVSQVICNFVVILNSVLGKVYCGIQFSMVGILGAVLTLYVALFGVQILLGTAQLNAKEIVIRLLKIAGVWAFATQSAWGIGLTFQFFLSLINDGSTWVVNGISAANPVAFPVTENGTDVMPIYGYIDTLIYNAITGPFTAANDKVIGFFLAMAIPFSPLLLMGLYWLWETLILLVNTVVGFMLCLSAIAFLITLSPIFLSFMLFQATRHFFESWLRYMVSYALQVIFVFAIIAMWISVMSLFAPFFSQLSDLIFPYQPIPQVDSVAAPVDTWAICPATYGDDNFGPTATCRAGFNPWNLSMVGPPSPAQQADFNQLIPPSAIDSHGDFLYFIIYHMITLIVIAYAFTALLKKAPKIAESLAGSGHIPILSGGWGNSKFGRIGGMGPAV